ncbi:MULTISPECIES: sulfatase-like hydrolase/transferase [unclassified Mycolicibacterium]|uniref:sulfatase-like hydrolase/transferase n=1 Tax=unclassified Mycolicibacterium TaxID=2636767 RepID=UPI0012DFE507|nr:MULTISPECIES: sulfatase-like hydrolase/transferase [unclassified Mycolicibacterium]MUL83702.1 sulfatase-like hydrolase/transferase [Mycolicibacterium sp. CBMA 329]MUL90693.1 sulfatase-like hydrolase/transferase [Mycolicibacterium sp. CBMA 331]MUM00662.1 sulfatase-like hydrolase/transferase [Mycolicibacterium sp. CBMA 334]MUM28633.1 sulfatase-like hydrolase/transferase [Mycolicibacterium sp. CBMA 295]MUM41637.1 sulfatase-like hydrolase/transferase [Mycolicibacterium sp. CBMA 247]
MAELSRRAVLGGAAVAAGAAAVGFGGYELLGRRSPDLAGQPNILVVIVDQMRAPQWFPDAQQLGALLPNLDRLRARSTSFGSHYSASNMCTPSRGVLTTGLYSHQTGCLYTGEGPTESTLAARFPTWGTMLRDAGYRTWWWGKWHLGSVADNTPDGLDAHGFSGGTYPSPNGAPNQGLQQDPSIVDQFTGWFDAHAAEGPWCTTVSLVNPHDICWWPKHPLPDDVPRRFETKPANFETADDLRRRGKPQLQIDYMNFMSPLMTGAMDYSGPDAAAQWARCLDMYLWLQQEVDTQIGRVLDTLAARPDIDNNTVVVFTSDHGEYAGSHGLRGKGAAVYEESIRVPLYIRDPFGHLTPSAGETRTQLTSSADLAPLLLTIAHGGAGWRSDSRYSYLAGRGDIAGIAADAAAPGRPWIAHATDDMSVEEMAALLKSPLAQKVFGAAGPPTDIPTSAPSHIVAVRTPDAKLGMYTYWKPGSMDIDTSRPIHRELYDYTTPSGNQELDNLAGHSSKQADLQALLDHEVLPELRAPLPDFLDEAQEQGLANMKELATLRGG